MSSPKCTYKRMRDGGYHPSCCTTREEIRLVSVPEWCPKCGLKTRVDEEVLPVYYVCPACGLRTELESGYCEFHDMNRGSAA